MTYGINIRPYDDPLIAIAEKASGTMRELMIAGTFLVDIIPILKYVPSWFPGAKFQRIGCRDADTCGKDSQCYLRSNEEN
jgi:hypothetical protein